MNEKMTVKEVLKLADTMEYICSWAGLTLDELEALFTNIQVKDEKGKWRTLVFCNNYSVEFECEGEVKINVHNPLYFGRGLHDITPFKDEYYIKRAFGKSDLDKGLIKLSVR